MVDPKLRSDYSMQTAIGVERQLPSATTVAVTYTNNRSVHLSQTVPINTPLPGTFNPLLPLSATNGVFPYGYNAGNILRIRIRRLTAAEHFDGEFQHAVQQPGFAVWKLLADLRERLARHAH